MKKVFIMRGVPGSGKTPKALELAGEKGKVHSTSDYFLIDGEYKFNPSKLQDYHADNYDAFVESLAFSVPVVVCDNTNVHHWEYERYMEAAEEYGYDVEIVVMPHPKPRDASIYGVHNVPEWKIKKMIENFEA